VRSPAWNAGDPVSLIAADIHLGLGRAGITAGGLEILYSNHVPTWCGTIFSYFSIRWQFCIASNGCKFMPF
jgi:hypothetical protein